MRILLSVLVMLLIVISMASYATAQSIPLPPPSPEGTSEEIRIAENDRTPPKIEILTSELTAGKNVFRVRIIDDSSLLVREVKYVSNGQLRIDGLFRDQNNVYKALVDIQPPSRVIVVTAGDASGNIASTYHEYDIKKSDDIFTKILNMLSQIPSFFQNLLLERT